MTFLFANDAMARSLHCWKSFSEKARREVDTLLSTPPTDYREQPLVAPFSNPSGSFRFPPVYRRIVSDSERSIGFVSGKRCQGG